MCLFAILLDYQSIFGFVFLQDGHIKLQLLFSSRIQYNSVDQQVPLDTKAQNVGVVL